MREVYDPIPKRCQSCPVIFPTLDAYIRREAELYVAQYARARLNEYADLAAIDTRIIDLRQEVSHLQKELEELRLRTLGCRGVLLSQVALDDERIDHYECPVD